MGLNNVKHRCNDKEKIRALVLWTYLNKTV